MGGWVSGEKNVVLLLKILIIEDHPLQVPISSIHIAVGILFINATLEELDVLNFSFYDSFYKKTHT